jgi:aminopeptidase N
MTQHQAKYRSDYRAPAFSIATIDLQFHLHDSTTRVINTMHIERLEDAPLELNGEQLQLVNVWLDGRVLDETDYQLTNTLLCLNNLPEQFILCIETQINPSANTALEGLYKSAGAYCTQCEAEGFRRISYYLDRPDVLAVFTTTIFADAQQFPYLLSNGNLIEQQLTDDGLAMAKWHDPHPKPAYLFALVAGDFDRIEDQFITQSGRTVALQLYVDHGNAARAQYAMQSLQNAMRWDEQRFGYEYDLDIYMIVAVDFFNMGAMENKGLNVFNSKYVLADAKTATDQDFIHVESVIGHEYFHNWTGNRITCRDWFQLSLKEGLTVFRDQEFSADLGSPAVHRIQAIKVIRSHQFNEDAGPMAHPIRPDKVVEMNNFYTVTVYNKGAEVIRMQHCLLSEQGFMRGMQLYTERHDGQAVTCEDFVRAMEQANGRDLQQFRRWYSQAGTPHVTVQSSPSPKGFCLTFTQTTPATPGQVNKQAQHMPVLLSAYSATGDLLELHSEALTLHESGSYLFEFTEQQQSIDIQCSDNRPVLALFENFSAPVKLNVAQSEADLLVLLAAAQQPVTRWEAAQRLYTDLLLSALKQQHQPPVLSDAAVSALQQLCVAEIDPALRALALTPPSHEEIAEHCEQIIPVERIAVISKQLSQAIAVAVAMPCAQVYQQLHQSRYELTATAISARSLRNLALHYLTAANADHESAWQRVAEHFYQADNLTDQHAALQTAVHLKLPIATQLLTDFSKQWADQTLVMDKWFAVQASVPVAETVETVERLLQHPLFTFANPNRVYALLATFGRNLVSFHRQDGAGYRLMVAAIKQLNESNPQVASRLITPLTQWRRFSPDRQQMLCQLLRELSQLPNLAADLEEKIEASLK